jgi:hypothetical protein
MLSAKVRCFRAMASSAARVNVRLRSGLSDNLPEVCVNAELTCRPRGQKNYPSIRANWTRPLPETCSSRGRLLGPLVPGLNEVCCNIDAPDIGCEPCLWQCCRSIAAPTIKHFESFSNSQALDESFSAVSHGRRNASKFPTVFYLDSLEPSLSVIRLFHPLGFPRLALLWVARWA